MKRVLIATISIVSFLIAASSLHSTPDTSDSSVNGTGGETLNVVSPNTAPKPHKKPTCNGTTVTTACVLHGITYTTYIYHPAIPEKSHTKTITTYRQQVVGYCTLCNDGTYSPSCATGRGACSYHGGVAQWNAPRYSNIPETSTRKVIDSPARKAFYKKVVEK